MRVVVIRPEPGCTATVGAARALGLGAEGWPLFEVQPRAWQPPVPDQIDALLLGSANAVRHFGPALVQFRGAPVYAVGQATAAEARAAGLTVAATGSGDLQGLLDTLTPPLRLLRVCGAEHVPLSAPPGIELVERVAYESVPLAMSRAQADTLSAGALVLLHSAAAMRHLRAECDRTGVARGALQLATLAPRIAVAAGDGWGAIAVAAAPTDAALLALARDMCQNPARN